MCVGPLVPLPHPIKYNTFYNFEARQTFFFVYFLFFFEYKAEQFYRKSPVSEVQKSGNPSGSSAEKILTPAMKIIRTEHKIEEKFRFLLPYMEDALLFDIETTGFSPAAAIIYLIGTAVPTGEDTLTVTQYFAEKEADEAPLLQAFLSEAASYGKFISFNGDAFDIPFIQKRAALYNLSFRPSVSIDLYREARTISPVFPMKSRKLKSIEQFFGIFREDTYSGGDLIKVWKDYARTGDAEMEHTVLLHNEEDVSDMFPVMALLELKKLLSPSVSVEKICPEADGTVVFEGKSGLTTPTGFTLSSKNAFFQFDGTSVRGSIHGEAGKKRTFFGNPKAYVFLLSENRVIPKALAASLPRSAVKKARLCDCYTESEGFFYPLPKDSLPEGERPWRDSFESTEIFIKKDPEKITPAFLSSYAALLISGILKGLC